MRCLGIKKGTVIKKVRIVSTQMLRERDAVSRLAEIITAYAREAQLEKFDVVAGLPASLDRKHDQILKINNVPNLAGVRLRTELARYFGGRIILEHDIMLQLMGELYAGAAVGFGRVFGVYFGTGIGAGCLLQGQPFRRAATGLEIGHIPVRCEGKLCVCGREDCFEAYAGGKVLLDWAETFARLCATDYLKSDTPKMSGVTA